MRLFVAILVALIVSPTHSHAQNDGLKVYVELLSTPGYQSAMAEAQTLYEKFKKIATQDDITNFYIQYKALETKFLNSEDPGIKVLGVTMYFSSDNPDVAKFLPLLSDPNPGIQAAAIIGLRDFLKKEGTKPEVVQLGLRGYKEALIKEKFPDRKAYIRSNILEIQDYYGIEDDESPEAKRAGTGIGFEILITSAEWCGPCHAIADNLKKENALKSITVEFEGASQTLPIQFADIDKKSEALAAMRISIASVPTFHLLYNGKVQFKSQFGTQFNLAGVKSLAMQGLQSYRAKSLAEVVTPEELKSKVAARPTPTSRIVLIGTGEYPDENPIFISVTLANVKKVLQSAFKIANSQFVTLYGAGPKSQQNDTMEEQDGRVVYSRATNLSTDASFQSKTLQAIFDINDEQKVAKSLWIYSGHGTSEGIYAWGEKRPLTKSYMSQLQANSDAQNIVVSGNCYGGQFALSTSCGFFGARPDKVASGCWNTQPSTIKDYASVFFNSQSRQTTLKTFEDAHWYAVINGAPEDHPYTSLDAIADEYFRDKDSSIPTSISVREAGVLVNSDLTTVGEKKAFSMLVTNLPQDFQIPLKKTNIELLIGSVPVNLELDPLRGSPSTPVAIAPENRATLSKIFRERGLGVSDIVDTSVLTDLVLYDKPSSGTHWEGTFYDTVTKTRKIALLTFDSTPEFLKYRPVLVQLLRRTLLKQRIASGQASYLRDRYTQIFNCETQSIGEFLK